MTELEHWIDIVFDKRNSRKVKRRALEKIRALELSTGKTYVGNYNDTATKR